MTAEDSDDPPANEKLKEMVRLYGSKQLTPDQEAVRAACVAGDIHLACAYPECKCKQTPVMAMAVWRLAYERAAKVAEECQTGVGAAFRIRRALSPPAEKTEKEGT